MKANIKTTPKIVAAISVILVLGSVFCQSEKSHNLIGEKSPDFSLITLDGEEVTLSQFKDKVVILNFWASWCGPCHMEIPDFIKMYKKYKKDGLEIIGVTLVSGTTEQIRSFVKVHEINYIILTSDEKYLQDLADQYGGIRGIPTTFLIDRKGIIRNMWVGARTKEIFISEMKKYL